MGLAAFFRRAKTEDNEPTHRAPVTAEESGEISVEVPNSPLCYTVDIRRTKDQGAEVVVSLHNTSETPIYLSGARLHYWYDDDDGGHHDLFFPEMGKKKAIKMLQYEVQEGHFHLPSMASVDNLHTRVTVDWRDERGTQHHKVSQHLSTVNINMRKGKTVS